MQKHNKYFAEDVAFCCVTYNKENNETPNQKLAERFTNGSLQNGD